MMSKRSEDDVEKSSEKLSDDEGLGILLGASSKLYLYRDEETRIVNFHP